MGPDITNNLTRVLSRFRQETATFMCDIEVMFYQIRVTEDCRDMLILLLWKNGDTSREPQEHMMAIHLFGTVSSPAFSNYALKKTATAGTAPADFLRDDFYVDDGLKSDQQVVKRSCVRRRQTGTTLSVITCGADGIIGRPNWST